MAHQVYLRPLKTVYVIRIVIVLISVVTVLKIW